MTAAALVPGGAVLDALAGAREIAFSAYTLRPDGTVARALEAAADRGAAVAVTLEAFADRPADDGLRAQTGSVAAQLRDHGVHVRLGVPNGDVVHLKAAVVDGEAFLDDRNWTSAGDTIVRVVDPVEVAAVRAAIDGRTGAPGGVATEKAAALDLEAATIRDGGDRIDVASESFGASAVSKAIRERATAGAHVRLLVNARIARSAHADRERAVLHRLANAGVEIRLTPDTEKLCTAGDRGWVGSANATFDAVRTTDWGVSIRDDRDIATLHATFEREWGSARPFA
jgi:hypothetical protein